MREARWHTANGLLSGLRTVQRRENERYECIRALAGTAYYAVYQVRCASLRWLLSTLFAPRVPRRPPRSKDRSHAKPARIGATRTSCGREVENRDGGPRCRSLSQSSPGPPPHLFEHSRNDAWILFSSTTKFRARGDIKQHIAHAIKYCTPFEHLLQSSNSPNQRKDVTACERLQSRFYTPPVL